MVAIANTFNSKKKGDTYERKTAKRLTEWWGHEFYRTPASGGLRWTEDNNVAGDIVTGTNSEFPFVIECKHREGNWTIESIMLDRHDVKNWYKQVVEDSRRVNRVPLLMFTRNRAEDFVMLPYAEDLYMKLLLGKQPIMRTVVAYTDAMTEKTEAFEVLITTLGGLTSLEPEYYKEWSKAHQWEEETLITYPDAEESTKTKSNKEKIDSILNMIAEED